MKLITEDEVIKDSKVVLALKRSCDNILLVAFFEDMPFAQTTIACINTEEIRLLPLNSRSRVLPRDADGFYPVKKGY